MAKAINYKRVYWNEEKLKKGFDKFIEENGRLPTTREVDKTEYLPSAREIIRKFGGLINLRNKLGYKTPNYHKGKHRSGIAIEIGKRGRIIEVELDNILRAKFHDVFVHSEKLFDRANKNRVDFLIYSPSGIFGVDIFYTDNFFNLKNIINIKQKKYINFPYELYLVVAGDKINQTTLDNYSANKTHQLKSSHFLMTTNTFKKIIDSKLVYNNPIAKFSLV